MILYSVTVFVDHEIEPAWRDWMAERHIPDVLASGYFYEARFYKLLESESERAAYRIDYRAENLATYRAYAAEAAPALQEEHHRKFAGRVEAARALAELIEARQPEGPSKET